MNETVSRAGRAFVALLVVVVAVLVGVEVFVRRPDDLAELLGVLVVVVTVPLAARVGRRIANAVFRTYNVAEVAVEGPITRDGRRPGPGRPVTEGADAVVEQMERADEDDDVDALLVKLNTPGGAVVPSDDVRRAAEGFDGPTVAYATDVCASGGYWIASGCDELWARDGSVVGSIGVRSPRFTATELLDRLGVEYQQFTAGEYKEAGSPFTELDEDDREYLQDIVDDYYDAFVDTVAEGREMDPEFLRDTEARVYLGEEACDLGLVDHLGTRADVEARLEDLLHEEAVVERFEPDVGLMRRVRRGATGMAYAFGAGVAEVLDDGDFRV